MKPREGEHAQDTLKSGREPREALLTASGREWELRLLLPRQWYFGDQVAYRASEMRCGPFTVSGGTCVIVVTNNSFAFRKGLTIMIA